VKSNWTFKLTRREIESSRSRSQASVVSAHKNNHTELMAKHPRVAPTSALWLTFGIGALVAIAAIIAVSWYFLHFGTAPMH
jgi:hypothetical protein